MSGKEIAAGAVFVSAALVYIVMPTPDAASISLVLAVLGCLII